MIPQRRIVGFHQDEEQHWVVELECGHTQHVRHTPPWQVRPWVLTATGRNSHLGTVLPCRSCTTVGASLDSELQRQFEQVRAALVDAAVAAHEDAGMRGLCGEGAFEAAEEAMTHGLMARRTP